MDISREGTYRLKLGLFKPRCTSGGTPLRSNPNFYQNGTIKWIKTKELNDYYVDDSEEKITEEALEKSSAKLFPPNTVLMAMYGDGKTITSLGILRTEAATNQACCALIADPEICHYLYLFYALKYHRPDFIQLATGGAQRNLSGTLIRNFALRVPPLPEQRAIARILGSLDDKIEANRRMNETLEAMARAIFKSWFVDFDPVRARAEGFAPAGMDVETAALFPDGFEENELWEIPNGWKVVRLSDICSTQYGYTESASDQPIGPHFLRVTDINKQNWIDWEKVPYCRISDKDFEKYRLRIGDIIVARMADPGKSAIIESNIAAVFASYLVRLKMESLSHSYYVYGFLKSAKYTDYVEGAKSGSVQANMNAKIITDIDLVLPDQDVLNAFLEKMLPLRMRLLSNIRESNIISEIRNNLLLNLISGEVSVKL
jgi:type I restriction enzyme S subunit